MSRYTLNLTAGGMDYSFGIDTMEGVFGLLASSTDITKIEVIDWVGNQTWKTNLRTYLASDTSLTKL